MDAEKIKKMNAVSTSLNRMWMVFARLVNPEDLDSISEFMQEKERIHVLMAEISGG